MTYHATLPMQRVGTRWLVLTPTQALMYAENLNLCREMSTAFLLAGRRPSRRWPSWMVA